MSSLMELVSHAAQIERAIIEANGELTPELEEALDFSEAALVEKAENYEAIFKRMELSSKYWKEEAAKFAKVGGSLEKLSKSLKERLKFAMLELGKEEIIGGKTRIKLCKTAPALVVDGDVPENYKMMVTETVVDKSRIKEDLVKGLEVPGAHLEGGFQLRFYPNKGE